MTKPNWDAFFANSQRGDGFVGLRYQRGGLALGSLFGGLLRNVLPAIKGVGKSVAKQALRTGMEVASDVLQGEDIKDSLENRGKVGAAVLLKKGNRAISKKAKGSKKKKTKKKQRGGGGLGTFKGKRVKGKRKSDIFG